MHVLKINEIEGVGCFGFPDGGANCLLPHYVAFAHLDGDAVKSPCLSASLRLHRSSGFLKKLHQQRLQRQVGPSDAPRLV